MPGIRHKDWHVACPLKGQEREDIMSNAPTFRGILGFLEHAAFVIAGLVLMIVGLGLGVTIVMLPAGVVIGVIGLAMVVGGLFARLARRV